MKQIRTWQALTIATLLAGAQLAQAAVSADEAAKLKSTLTPLGAEKAANKDGTIPAWTGGVAKGEWKKDPFAQDKPVVQISAQNMASYADKLSDGAQALLKKYPDTYRVDVYPTRRTMAASQEVYDNTFKNATRAKTTEGGMSVEGAFGGIPFPIPANGSEAMWNHVLRVRAESLNFVFRNLVGSNDGTYTVASQSKQDLQSPYYSKSGSADKWTGDYFLTRQMQVAPPFKAGESLVLRDSVDVNKARQAWQYLVGQRRVRRAPTVGYDTPDFVSSGANYFDELGGFIGALDRYEWKLIGKKEMIVPYNNSNFIASKLDSVVAGRHLNPDHVRWENHRVWVIEATVAAGKRHAVPKRRYYLDEDSWSVLMVDGYDATGKLWRAIHTLPVMMPEAGAMWTENTMIYNLQAGSWSMTLSINELLDSFKNVSARPDTYFTGDALGAEGVR